MQANTHTRKWKKIFKLKRKVEASGETHCLGGITSLQEGLGSVPSTRLGGAQLPLSPFPWDLICILAPEAPAHGAYVLTYRHTQT